MSKNGMDRGALLSQTAPVDDASATAAKEDPQKNPWHDGGKRSSVEEKDQQPRKSLRTPSECSGASYSFRRYHSYDDSYSTTESTASSSTTTSSAHCCVCNAASTSDLIPRRRRRRLSAADKGNPFPWAACVPMVALTVLAALLVLFAISKVARESRLVLSLPATQRFGDGAQERAPPLVVTGAVSQLTPVGSTIFNRSNSTRGSVKAATWTRAISSTRGKRKKVRQTPRAGSNEDEGASKTSEDTLVFPFRLPDHPACGSAFYTFCDRAPRREYHYQRATNACVEADAMYTCNRAANRFATLDQCLQSCVTAEHPADECFDSPLFTRCDREDIVSNWWHYEDGKCVPWAFPSGGCPANGSVVFTTSGECERLCSPGKCQRARSVACARWHLKYPYFAHLSAGEARMRCLRSSAVNLRGRLCLAGANRFRSLGKCAASCAAGP